MPRGDGTGPVGMGEMTGRGAGFCAGYGMPGYANPIPGRGFGAGYGRGAGFGGGFGRSGGFGGGGFGGGGRGWRNMFWATGQPGWMRSGAGATVWNSPLQQDPDLEKRFLRNQAQALQAQLDHINKRLGALEENPQEG
ncbi:MAG: DUF5320 domain-containing protein [Deltaproteobacteria bacterium]|nr:DUF5320 domain-containing protein [Deltaproteobacteria bacterium]